MFRKKKLIWFETEPVIAGAELARVRGGRDDVAHGGGTGSPYYGPVTIRAAVDRPVGVAD